MLTKAYKFNINQPPNKSRNILCSYKDAIIFSDDNISVLLGKKKTGKSIACQDFITGALYGGTSPLGFKWKECPKDKYVYYFDTELSTREFYDRLKLLSSNGEESLEKLQAYNIKGLSYNKRREFIQEATKRGDAYMIIIDVVSDLLIDFNSITESVEVVDIVQEVSLINNCPILLTLHLNPSDNIKQVTKGKGQLGVLLGNKTQSTLITSKIRLKNYFDLSFVDLRNGYLDNEHIKYMYDKDSLYKRIAYNKEEHIDAILKETPMSINELVSKMSPFMTRHSIEKYVKSNKSIKKRSGTKGKYYLVS